MSIIFRSLGGFYCAINNWTFTMNLQTSSFNSQNNSPNVPTFRWEGKKTFKTEVLFLLEVEVGNVLDGRCWASLSFIVDEQRGGKKLSDNRWKLNIHWQHPPTILNMLLIKSHLCCEWSKSESLLMMMMRILLMMEVIRDFR